MDYNVTILKFTTKSRLREVLFSNLWNLHAVFTWDNPFIFAALETLLWQNLQVCKFEGEAAVLLQLSLI